LPVDHKYFIKHYLSDTGGISRKKESKKPLRGGARKAMTKKEESEEDFGGRMEAKG